VVALLNKLAVILAAPLVLFMALFPLYPLVESLSLGEVAPEPARLHYLTGNTLRLWAGDWRVLQREVLLLRYADGGNPPLVVIADSRCWQQAAAMAPLAAAPVDAALVISEPTDVSSTIDLIRELAPRGAGSLDGLQVVVPSTAGRLGLALKTAGLSLLEVQAEDYPAMAGEFLSLALQAGARPRSVMLIGQDSDPHLNSPAAAWAAHRGTPILFTEKDQLPPATRQALGKLGGQPSIYLLGSSGRWGDQLAHELKGFGPTTPVGQADPVRNALDFARFYDAVADWGWNVTQRAVEGSRNLYLAPKGDWRMAAAGAQLGATGAFGPLLLSPGQRLAPEMEKFLFQAKPDWWVTPAEGPYNTVWLLGDTSHLTYDVQARVDFLQETSNYENQGKQAVSGLEGLSIVWYAVAAAGALWLWFHSGLHLAQLTALVRLSWVLVVLTLGPVGIWAYLKAYQGYGRQVAQGQFPRPLRVRVLAATCLTFGFGVPTAVLASFLFSYFGAPLAPARGPLFVLGNPLFQTSLWAFAAALAVNVLIFVPALLSANNGTPYGTLVRRKWSIVLASLSSIAAGLLSSRWWLLQEYLERAPGDEDILWWGTFYAAGLLGLLTGYVGNWFLVSSGKRKGTS